MAEKVEATITNISRQAAEQFAAAMQTAAGGQASSSNPDGDKMGKQTKKTVGALESLENASTNVSNVLQDVQRLTKGTLIGGLVEEFRSSVSTGTDAIGDYNDYINRSINAYRDLGVTLQEVNEASKTARAAQINLGGFAKTTQKLTEAQEFYYQRTGENSTALKYQAEMLNTLTRTGTDSQAFFSGFGKQIAMVNDDLLKMGVSYEESLELFQENMADENVRNRLRSAASKQERQAIMLEIQGRVAHFTQMGMTIEQAKKAASALEELGGASPIDRFKQAAKAQAAFAAMGVEGGAQVAETIRLGARATEEQRRTAAEAMGRLQDTADAARQAGLGQEMLYSTIMERTGMDQIASQFTTMLETGAKVSDEQLEHMKIMGQDTEEIARHARNLDILNNILENHPLMGVLDIAGSLGGILQGIAATLGISGISKMGAGGALKAAAGLLGRLGAVGAAGYGLYQAHQAVTTGRSDVHDWMTEAFPKFSEKLSDTVGFIGDTAKAGWGDEEALSRLSKMFFEDNKMEQQQTTRETKRSADAAERNATMAEMQLETMKTTNEVLEEMRRKMGPGMWGTGDVSTTYTGP